MKLTRQEAKALGLGAYWPKESPPTPAADGLNKTERAFQDRLMAARDHHTFQAIWREPVNLRLAGKTFYRPDFMTLGSLQQLTLWEVKGFMRDDAAVKLKCAAALYPCFAWVLVQRDRGAWRCTDVTSRGFARESYCPEWLA